MTPKIMISHQIISKMCASFDAECPIEAFVFLTLAQFVERFAINLAIKEPEGEGKKLITESAIQALDELREDISASWDDYQKDQKK